ncbi:MAG: hypothetical protein KJ072_24715 [Verrucomicrobia bacterium]|nr:hypothetical protein [Verrucomicrobiota bacterium]
MSRFSGTSASLNAVTFTDGMFVAVGETGTILSSTDTLTWRTHSQTGFDDLCGVAFGGGIHVAVGQRGIILVSPGLQDWQLVPSGTTNTLRSVTFGEGGFVAVGDSGVVVSSRNGTEWTRQNADSTQDLRGVCFGSAGFVAVGAGGTLLHSRDGGEWTQQTSRTTDRLNGVTWRDGWYVAVGEGGTVRSSPDGVTWFSEDMEWSSAELLAIVRSDHGEFMAVGPGGTITTAIVWDSKLSWGNGSLGYFGGLTSVAYGNGAFVATAQDATTLYSGDGADWIWRKRLLGFYINSVCYGQGMLVGAGTAQLFPGSLVATTYLAANGGVYWDFQPVQAGLSAFSGVHYGDQQFIAVGDRGLLSTSKDGVVWELGDSGTDFDLRGVAYGNNRYVVVGPRAVLTSPNGRDWSTSNAAVPLAGVVYGNGRFVAVGASGAIVTSESGDSWIRRDSGTSNTLYGVAYGGGAYVAVGTDIVTSPDGTNWVRRPNPTTAVLRSIAYGGGSFIAVGDGYTVLQSGSLAPRLTGLRTHEPDGFLIVADGWVEAGSQLQVAEELNSWAELGVFPSNQRGASFLDTSAANHRQRFYRLALP